MKKLTARSNINDTSDAVFCLQLTRNDGKVNGKSSQ